MPTLQPSLWDNVTLENGLQCLSDLRFDEALRQLESAQRSGPDLTQVIPKAIEACNYWKPKVENMTTAISEAALTSLLDDYAQYAFIPQLSGFKKNLLTRIAGFAENAGLNAKDMQRAFDLLLEEKLYEKAEDLITAYLKQHPEDHQLLYLLAQAKWRNNHKAGANDHYSRALLYHPDKNELERIENNRLKQLVQSYGPELAPAYAWVQKILPFIPATDQIKALNKQHQKALACYGLLKNADKALKNKDNKSIVHYRKQLKETAPELFEIYFKHLKQ